MALRSSTTRIVHGLVRLSAPEANLVNRMTGVQTRSVASSSTSQQVQVSPSQTSSSSASTSQLSSPLVQKKEDASDEFVVPSCLLPAQSLPQTHGVHVATLHLRSYNDSLQNLDLFADFARRAAFSIGIPASGVAMLPTRTSLWTVPKGPFVHKKSQENFWRKTHSRAIKLWDANDQVVDRLMHFLRIHAMPGVGMKAELYRHHSLGIGSRMLEESRSSRRNTSTSSSSKETSTTVTLEAVDGLDGIPNTTEGSGIEASTTQTAEGSAETIKGMADKLLQKELETERKELAEQQQQQQDVSGAKSD
ncbi:ribosomal protein S10 [Violaceomyces palustris]|uniref:Ribosomal protein S10 n=1 Tax=Violaceomyces palustris TaxID=1673888 RepID=A0ACD0NZ56_9BASI|nr:ribosomal protein S10 [Violaceomyces palustris]